MPFLKSAVTTIAFTLVCNQMYSTAMAILLLTKNSSYLNSHFTLYKTKIYLLIAIKYKCYIALLYQSSKALCAHNILKQMFKS